VFATTLSAIGVIVGDFKIEVDNKGWRSRGTLIANREMQSDLLIRYQNALFEDVEGTLWNEMQTVIQTGYVDIADREENGRRLSCDTSWYSSSDLFSEDNLFAVWKAQPSMESASMSILDKEVLSDICEAEAATLASLEDNGACISCDNDKCLSPHSLILVLRGSGFIDGGENMNCSELMSAYTSSVQSEFTASLVNCTNSIRLSFDPATSSYDPNVLQNCPVGFRTSLVDNSFGVNGNEMLRYTSSYFHTSAVDFEKIYQVWKDDLFDEGSNPSVVRGVYDTIYENINDKYVDELVQSDMGLAVASLLITFIAIGIHTRSLFLTVLGIFQIVYAIPLAYFVYTFIGGLNFFPFLNFIGVFVAAALGADDLFVAVDKWKNARIEKPEASTEDVAEVALPDAAGAMLLTTSTTAVAFFATAICPVTPILCFAVFCGLMIIWNYIMNIMIVFPALCLYDIWLQRGSSNCLIACYSKNLQSKKDIEEAVETKTSFIHRILTFYYNFVHKFRWAVLLVSLAAIIVCTVFALKLQLPETSEVRLLPEGHPLELHFMWRANILAHTFFFSAGTGVQVVWGMEAYDNGKQNDPDSLSVLKLDSSFDASSSEAQLYLKNFCDIFFDTDFALKPTPDYICPFESFDSWLQVESAALDPSSQYTSNCGNASSLPMDPNLFDKCILAWSQAVGENNILGYDDKLRIIRVRSQSRTSWTDPYNKIDKEWNNFEDFLAASSATAPSGVNRPFHVSGQWHWFDTNGQMLKTAIGSAAIALGFSGVVVLFASRSLVLTVFSAVSILYVLAATTSSLVAAGWSLGFLESICFAILIGISCDFVIHFGHAYIKLDGDLCKEERTKYAVIHMGPSILAAAATTFSASLVMMFCKIVFFTKFALILLMTVVHATIGSFVVYIVFADIFGPSEPTKFFDRFLKLKKNDSKTDEGSSQVESSFHEN
jgi:5-methyltetrahydrofolate--homocysteine methyltransferase